MQFDAVVLALEMPGIVWLCIPGAAYSGAIIALEQVYSHAPRLHCAVHAAELQ